MKKVSGIIGGFLAIDLILFIILFIIISLLSNVDDSKNSMIVSGIFVLIIDILIIYSETQTYKNRQEIKDKKKQDELNSLRQSAKDGIKCPKCSSTQIQVVKRGWNIATGILENNIVDRVCVNCKHRW